MKWQKAKYSKPLACDAKYIFFLSCHYFAGCRMYVTVVTKVGGVENYVTVVLSRIRLSVTSEDLFYK